MTSLDDRDLRCLAQQLHRDLVRAREESALRLDRCERLQGRVDRLEGDLARGREEFAVREARLQARVDKLSWQVARLRGRDRWHQRRVRDAVDRARYLHGVLIAAGLKFPEKSPEKRHA